MARFVGKTDLKAVGMAFSLQTGGGTNPARDLGPRLMLLAMGYGSGLFKNPY